MKHQTICFVNTTKAWGGGEKWHFDAAMHFQNHGHNVIAITNKNSRLHERLVDKGIRCFRVRITKLSFLNPFIILKIARILKKESVRCMVMNLSSDMKTAGLAAGLAKTEKVVYRRGSAIAISNTWLKRFVFKHIITDIIANSEETKRLILVNNPEYFDKEKIRVIYNGIDIKKYDSQSSKPVYLKENNEIVLGNAGRMVRQKGQFYLIEIAKILKNKDLNFKLLIAGIGKLEKELKEMVEKAGLTEHILFIGFVRNIKDFMESIDIFLLPSLWEGFGYVIAEAMASRKPVIAWNVSSNPEVIAHEKTGYLIESNDIAQFAERTFSLSKNTTLQKNLGHAARQRVEQKFDIEKNIQEAENLLQG